MKKKKNEEKLYPIFFNGKWYKEKDCDNIFTAFYHTRFALNGDCAVYVSNGSRVCPDGTWIHE